MRGSCRIFASHAAQDCDTNCDFGLCFYAVREFDSNFRAATVRERGLTLASIRNSPLPHGRGSKLLELSPNTKPRVAASRVPSSPGPAAPGAGALPLRKMLGPGFRGRLQFSRIGGVRLTADARERTNRRHATRFIGRNV